VENKEN
jgi:hypothetical protein